MFKKFYLSVLLFIVGFLFICSSQAQTPNLLRSRCPSPNSNIYQSLALLANGNINAVPCPSGSFLVNGLPLGGTINGTTTANFIPYSTGVDTLADSPLGWNGTAYSFNNTALNSQFILSFEPSLAGNGFRVGDYTTTPTYYFLLGATGTTELSSLDIGLGDLQAQGNGTRFDISDTGNLFTFSNTAGTYSLNFNVTTGLFNLDGDYQYNGTTVITNQFGFPLLGTDAQFYVGGSNSTPIFQGRNVMSVGTATYTPLILRGAAAQSGNLFELQNSASSVLTNFTANGAWQPASMADASAANNTVYYSTTASKLVYKDSGGVVNALY